MDKGHGGGERVHTRARPACPFGIYRLRSSAKLTTGAYCWNQQPMREPPVEIPNLHWCAFCFLIQVLLEKPDILWVSFSSGSTGVDLEIKMSSTQVHTEVTVSDYQSPEKRWTESPPGTGPQTLYLVKGMQEELSSAGKWGNLGGDAPSPWSPYTFNKHNLLCTRKLHINPSVIMVFFLGWDLW